MAFRFKRFFTYFVLYSFFFQTLWPSVVFARVEVPLGASWQDNPCGLTFKVTPYKDSLTEQSLVRIQAFSNPKEEWVEQVAPSSKPPTVSPSAPAPKSADDKIKKLLDRVVNIKTFKPIESDSAYALYNDLVANETGISWGFLGLSFVLDWNWNIVTTGTSLQDMVVKICTQGNIGLDNVFARQILAKGKTVSVRGEGKIHRLDVWATGDAKTTGTLRITKDSRQEIAQLSIHQGKGENYGNLRIQESLHQTETFDNHKTIQLDKGATVKGGKIFTNTGTVEGETYTVQSDLVRNQSTGSQKAVMKATQSLTLEAKKVEQKGSLDAPLLDLTKVAELEDDASATLKSKQLKTSLQKSWTPKGILETDDWQDTSREEVFIQNQGTFITQKTASIDARFRTLQGGKTDLTGVNFKNSHDRYQTLVNEGEMVLRKVQDLGGYHKDIDNRAGGSLVFLDCGYSWHYQHQRDEDGVPTSGGLHLGTVRNAGTIGFGGGTYRTHGLFTNTTTGVHEVLDGQELWMKDLINDGVQEAKGTYRIDQRLGVFTKLGKVLVDGKLITQISERAIRNKTGGTTWKHTGHIEADDWVDESDATVTIENTGTIKTRNSATLSAQFFTGKNGISDLTGLSLAKPLTPGQALINQGETILRKVKSLGDPRRKILNEQNGKLAFLDGEYSTIRGDSETGGLTMGDVTNYGTISFGGGEYYTDVFVNYNLHEALTGQKLWCADLINHGETRSERGYLVDMTRGTFTKLGKLVVTGGSTTIQFAPGVDAGQYLTNNDASNWELENFLKVEAPSYHNTADLILTVPFYLWVSTFLNDGKIHSNGFFLRSQTFGQGTLGGRLGEIKSGDTVDIEVEGDIHNQRGIIESAEEGDVVSTKGDVHVGQGAGGPTQQKNGSYIFSHKRLKVKARNINVRFGEIGSKRQLDVTFKDNLLLESGTLRSRNKTVFKGRSVIVKRADPYANGETVNNTKHWCNEWRQRDGGEAAQVLSGHDIEFLVDHMRVIGSTIAAFNDITDKDGKIIKTVKDSRHFSFEPMNYYEHSEKHDKWPKTTHQVYDSRPSTLTCSGQVDLNFSAYQLAQLIMAAASVDLNGDTFLLGSNSSPSFSRPGSISGWISLLPALQSSAGGIMQYQSPTQNPCVVYSTGAMATAHTHVIDPALLTLVRDSINTLSFFANPSADPFQRQISDEEGLVWALQLTLIAATGKGYLFPRKGASDHLRILLENAKRLANDNQYVSEADAEKSTVPLLVHRKATLDGKSVHVPYLFVPPSYLNRHLLGNSRGTIAADEGVTVNMSSFLGVMGGNMAAKTKDIDLNSDGNMSLGAAADTHQQGKNSYQTQSGGRFNVDEGKLKAKTKADLKTTAVTVETAEGAELEFGGDRVDETLGLASHTVIDHGDGETVTDRVDHARSTYKHTKPGAKHKETGTAQSSMHRYAPLVQAASAEFTAGTIIDHDVHDTVHSKTTRKEDGGFLGGKNELHEETSESTSKGAVFQNADGSRMKDLVYNVLSGNSVHTNVNWQCERVFFNVKNGRVFLLSGQNTKQTKKTVLESNGLWQYVSQDMTADKTFSPCQFAEGCKIEFDSKTDVYIQSVRGHALKWIDGLKKQGVGIQQEELDEIHLSDHFETDGPTAGLMVVVALGVTIATMGTGSGIGATLASTMGLTTTTATGAIALTASGTVLQAMTAATFSSLCVSAAGALVQNGFDPNKALKDFLKTETLKAAMKAAAVAGLLKVAANTFGGPTSALDATTKAAEDASKAAAANTTTIPGTTPPAPTLAQSVGSSFSQHAQFQAMNALSKMAADAAISGKADGKGIALNAVTNAVAAVATNQIAFSLKHEFIGKFGQIALHGGVGGALAAALGGKDAMAQGAIIAAAAETIASLTKEDQAVSVAKAAEKLTSQGIQPTRENMRDCIQDDLRAKVDMTRFGLAFASLLASQNVQLSIDVATNSLENNDLSLMADYTEAALQSMDEMREALKEMTCEKLDQLAKILEGNPELVALSLVMAMGTVESMQQDRGMVKPAKSHADTQAKRLVGDGIKAWAKHAPTSLRDMVKNIRASKGSSSASAAMAGGGPQKPTVAPKAADQKKSVSFAEDTKQPAQRELHDVSNPGRIQSRINIREGDGTGKSPGLANAWRKHGDTSKPNKSQFTISKDELKIMLQNKAVVQASIRVDPHSGSYVREVDLGKTVGRLPVKGGLEETSKITILTDQHGNLVNVYPGPFAYKGN